MGFFSAIGGFISSVGSFVGSAISGVCSVAVGAVKAVGSALSTLASGAVGLFKSIATKAANFVGLVAKLPLGPLGPILGPILEKVIIYFVTKAIEKLAKKLGIIGNEDKAEEVGYRVEEAQSHDDWKKQEDFKSFEEYYAYLKEQIPDDKIDRRKLEENRDRYSILGTMELTSGIEERMEIKLPEDFLFEIGRSRMEQNEILAIVEAFKSLDSNTVYVSDYFKGKLSRDENIKIEDALLVALRKYYPDRDDDYFYERLGVMRMASRDDTKLADVYSDKLTEENFKRIEREDKIPDDL